MVDWGAGLLIDEVYDTIYICTTRHNIRDDTLRGDASESERYRSHVQHLSESAEQGANS